LIVRVVVSVSLFKISLKFNRPTISYRNDATSSSIFSSNVVLLCFSMMMWCAPYTKSTVHVHVQYAPTADARTSLTVICQLWLHGFVMIFRISLHHSTYNLRGLLALSHSFLTSLWRTQHQATSDQATTEQISHFLNLELKSHVFSNCVICFSSGCSRQQVLASQGANSHGAMHDPCFAIWICLFPFLTFTLSKYYPFNVHRRL
jgi:hypothetical protein